MLDFLTLAGLSSGATWLIKEVLGPLSKAAAEDFYKDFLKRTVSEGLAQNVPGPVKKAIAQSLKEFLELFQAELETCGLPKELTKHEFASPLKQLLADPEVRQVLGQAFETDAKAVDGALLQAKWQGVCSSSLLEDFDWEQLAKNYLRRVKRIVREDAELSRQLDLDYQAKMSAATAELVGVPVAFDLKQYQQALKEKFGSLSLDSLDTDGAAYDNLRLWKVFVAQDVRECAEFAPQIYERSMGFRTDVGMDARSAADVMEQQRRRYVEKPVESVGGVVGLGGRCSTLRAVILGNPGSGKSTLLRAIALSWAEKSAAALRNEPIPILIELRLYAQDKNTNKCNSFLEYLHKGNTTCHLNQRELDELLKSGHAVAMFDGVDEVFDPKLREVVVNDIHRFSNSYSQVQIVVTSRWLGYKAETLRNAGFQQYMLQDLTAEQIESFLEKWHGLTFTTAQAAEKDRKQARLQKAITESRAIRELAGNPLLLTMMAILNRNQELPRDRALLYEKASDVLLHQWDVNEKVHKQVDLDHWKIELGSKQTMLRKIAHHMQTNEFGQSGNVITQDNLEQILTDYLKTLEVDRARAIAKIMIEQLRERNFILCYLGEEKYAFVHRTFLEYFCAREFVHRFEKEKTLDSQKLQDIYAQYFQDESWSEVLRLMAGMIEPRFVGHIIDHLLAQPVDLWAFARFENYIFSTNIIYLKVSGISNLLLAADCFAEVKVRGEISGSAKSLLARLKRTVEDHYPYRLESDAATGLMEAIASNWSEQPETLSWLKSCLLSRNSNIPAAAVEALAQGWKDEPDTLPMLKSRALEDENEDVRSAAIEALAQGWKDEPDTLPWLKLRALKDENEDVRRAAVSALAQGWKKNLELFDFWCDRTLQDPFEREKDWQDNPRQIALEVLVQQYPKHPKTEELLRDRAQNDNDEQLRTWVKEQLVRLDLQA